MAADSPNTVPFPPTRSTSPDARAEDQAGTMHQWSMISALMSRVYDGEMTLGELGRHGDFGLGTFNALDGELVALDGQFYHVHADGSAGPTSPNDKTPFAEVTFFRPESSHSISGPLNKGQLHALLTQWTQTNQFSAIRIDGRFRRVTTRTVARQTKPYRPLTVVTESQAVTHFTEVTGTLVGFRAPTFMQGIAVAGYHLHFLSEDRCRGGHALDYELDDGIVQIASLPHLHLQLPTSEEFEGAVMSLSATREEEIRKSEG